MLVSKTLKFGLPPTPTLKFALPPMRTPNANRWNIGHVGSPTENSRIGHEDVMLFVSLSLVLGSQCENNSQRNMGFRFSPKQEQFWPSSGH